MTSKVSATELRRFVSDVFRHEGMAAADAGAMADTLVWANLRGVDTHGVTRLPRYLEMIHEGLMNVGAKPAYSYPAPSSLVIDADRAPGPVVLSHAVERLKVLAKEHGIALALVGQMTHSGALGYYTSNLAEAGLACLAFNAGNAFMPYHGARGLALGTNPISIAVPGGDSQPLVLDMASSAVAMGKLTLARKTGTPLEPGWAVDEAGNPTTDPAKAAMSTPLGGPKGSGLSLMVEILASLLSGNPLVADALQKTGEGGKHRQNAMLIAIDIATFVDMAEFGSQVQRLVGALKALPLAAGSVNILMPGERGYLAMIERSASGIPLPPPVVTELAAVAERFKIDPLALQA